MARVAHVRSGAVVRLYEEGTGRLTLESGDTASPVVAGYTNGNDSVLPVVDEVADTSTGPDTISTRALIVEVSQVRNVLTIRDKTAQELDEEADAEIENQFRRDLANWALEITNRVRALEGGSAVTMTQLKAYVKGLR